MSTAIAIAIIFFLCGLIFYLLSNSYVHVEPLPKQTKNRVNPVVVAVALLKCFNDGQQGCKPFAPWGWSAPQKDVQFAREVVQSMRLIGAREDLCRITIARGKDVARADEQWAEIVSGLRDHSKDPGGTVSTTKIGAASSFWDQ